MHPGLSACMEAIAEKVYFLNYDPSLWLLKWEIGHKGFYQRPEFQSLSTGSSSSFVIRTSCFGCSEYSSYRKSPRHRVEISQPAHHVFPVAHVRSNAHIRNLGSPHASSASLWKWVYWWGTDDWRLSNILNSPCCFQYNPSYEFNSDRSGISLQLSDSYQVRNDMLGQLKRNANTWFELALGRAPMELQSTLQVFLSSFILHMNLTVCERNTLQSTKHLPE